MTICQGPLGAWCHYTEEDKFEIPNPRSQVYRTTIRIMFSDEMHVIPVLPLKVCWSYSLNMLHLTEASLGLGEQKGSGKDTLSHRKIRNRQSNVSKTQKQAGTSLGKPEIY